ncbi:MAG: P1 family peptidase [Chloroflexota bacterium]
MTTSTPLYTAGLKIGHATDYEKSTGCTVFICPSDSVGGVDVRGMAPGSRETQLLDPIKAVADVNAILFSGGSAFGLAAADGVMRNLDERKIGHYTPARNIPLVPTAIIFDGSVRHAELADYPALGYAAVEDAFNRGEKPLAQGAVGAGCGATVGKWSWDFTRMMKGGIGFASYRTEDDIEVFAAAVVNAIGDVVNPDGSVLAGARDLESGGWLVTQNPLRLVQDPRSAALENTTLVLIATNAKLNKIETNRLAQRGHDGMAIAIRPVHTNHDGDSLFTLSTGNKTGIGFDMLANIGVHCVEEAIRNAVREAETMMGVPGLKG